MSIRTSITNARLSRAACAVALLVLLASLAGCEPTSAPYQISDAKVVAQIRDTLGGGDGGEEEEAPTEQPTGFSTLSGRITLAGTPPPNPVLDVNKDPNVCAPGGGPVYGPEFVVSDDGGFANVLIFLDTNIPDDPLWLHESAQSPAEDVVEFDQEECLFLSPIFAFQTGQTLRILNSDPIGHNTFGKPASNSSFNVNLAANGSSDISPFDASERSPFSVKCSIHPWMQAYMFCRDNGYFAVTDAEGNFTIPNLPAGVDLELKIWHESCGFGLANIEVNGSEERLSRGKWSVRLSPEEPERTVEMVIQSEQLQ